MSKLNRREQNKYNWIIDTPMFQRIAKVNVSTYEDLEKEWESFNPKQKTSNLKHIQVQRTIQRLARGK